MENTREYRGKWISYFRLFIGGKMELLEYHNMIKEALYEARRKILSKKLEFNHIEEKTNSRDLVTIVDKEIEKFLVDKIKYNFPEHYILGEESYDEDYEIVEENVWVIDPIDATANFIKQEEDYCILIGFFQNKIPKLGYIYNVKKDELIYSIENKGVYVGEKKIIFSENIDLNSSLISIDVRKLWKTELLEKLVEKAFDLRFIGCAGLDGAKVVQGKFGAFICPNLGPWDFAPLQLMAKELNLHISDFDGNNLEFGKRSDFILSTHKVYKEIRELLKK